MSIKDITPIIISILSLVVSGITSYKTLFSRFSGKIWQANRFVLTHINGVPSIGLACFFENSGAKPGFLDDLRLIAEHRESGGTYKFYPILIRDDYNIFAKYGGEDWFPFSGIILAPKNRTDRYILFKPLDDKFVPQKGRFIFSLQSRWGGEDEWKNAGPSWPCEIPDQIVQQWNDPEAPSFQITSETVQKRRYVI